MKVTIGKYTKWIGPYQIADYLPFDEDTRHKIGAWLDTTWVKGFCEWVQNKKERKVKIRIDNYDTWNMDHTLALIILPMLKQLKATKHGSPMVDNEDVPPEMRHSNVAEDDDYHSDNWVHYKWEWVLNEMIFAFENIVDDSWENDFFHDEEGRYSFDKENYNRYNDRISNGLRLFGKYYRGLWD